MSMTDLRAGDAALLGLQMVEVEEVSGDRALVGWRCPHTGEDIGIWADVKYLRDTERRN
mgnify:CR=1 FL=1